MSTESREYTRLLPVLATDDLPTLQWLTRESFENTAAADGLVIAAYADAVVDPTGLVPRAVAAQLDRPVDEYEWHLFTATAVRPERAPLPDHCGYCAPHPSHSTPCTHTVGDGDDEKPCRCPGWPL
ncbi:hypothetical protein [Mycolicibacterium mageritense]|uniref:hypothetical protein n=1 Tax=Mycolicibacterium mageritense TaxID=53462 RepID=UPI001E3015D0|nr:hypothetical protein [Mycolicibacterium mageritense]MCC9181105.1 hypothetical protein [Mycolicibacterium mageritense]